MDWFKYTSSLEPALIFLNMTILSLIVDFKMRRRYTDQGAGIYVMNDDLTMSFGGSSLTSVAYSKNNSYICSEHYNRINGSLTSVTMNTGDTIWTMRKQNSRLLPTKVGSGKLETSLSCDLCGNVTVIDQSGALREINNYYPYGGLMGGAVTGIQPDKYSGKELDRENGIDWYDFEARYQDPMLPMFTTQDPLAEQTPGTSPYAYCAGNPIRYIDPSGMLWLKSQWYNDTYYMFDKDINNEFDLRSKYGEGANLSLVGDGSPYYKINVGLKGYDGENFGDVTLNIDGSIMVNGETKKEYEFSTAHFSNLDNYWFSKKYQSNFFYSFYIGPDNPKLKGGIKDSYHLPPINYLDYIAMLHDKEYDSLDLKGAIGVLNPKSVFADYRLAEESLHALSLYEPHTKEYEYSQVTGYLFYSIFVLKMLFLLSL